MSSQVPKHQQPPRDAREFACESCGTDVMFRPHAADCERVNALAARLNQGVRERYMMPTMPTRMCGQCGRTIQNDELHFQDNLGGQSFCYPYCPEQSAASQIQDNENLRRFLEWRDKQPMATEMNEGLKARKQEVFEQEQKGSMRRFATGATRDSDETKNDYEGFLSPLVLEAYGDFMTLHRVQTDGKLRASDNWQLGIERQAYMKSLLRHVFSAWALHRGWPVKPEMMGGQLRQPTLKECLCGVLFNAMGYLHELIKEELQKKDKVA